MKRLHHYPRFSSIHPPSPPLLVLRFDFLSPSSRFRRFQLHRSFSPRMYNKRFHVYTREERRRGTHKQGRTRSSSATLWYIAPWRSMTSAIFLPLSPASNFPFLTCTPPHHRFGLLFYARGSRISNRGHRPRVAPLHRRCGRVIESLEENVWGMGKFIVSLSKLPPRLWWDWNDDNENSRLFQKFGERKGKIVGTTLTNILN